MSFDGSFERSPVGVKPRIVELVIWAHLIFSPERLTSVNPSFECETELSEKPSGAVGELRSEALDLVVFEISLYVPSHSGMFGHGVSV